MRNRLESVQEVTINFCRHMFVLSYSTLPFETSGTASCGSMLYMGYGCNEWRCFIISKMAFQRRRSFSVQVGQVKSCTTGSVIVGRRLGRLECTRKGDREMEKFGWSLECNENSEPRHLRVACCALPLFLLQAFGKKKGFDAVR